MDAVKNLTDFLHQCSSDRSDDLMEEHAEEETNKLPSSNILKSTLPTSLLHDEKDFSDTNKKCDTEPCPSPISPDSITFPLIPTPFVEKDAELGKEINSEHLPDSQEVVDGNYAEQDAELIKKNDLEDQSVCRVGSKLQVNFEEQSVFTTVEEIERDYVAQLDKSVENELEEQIENDKVKSTLEQPTSEHFFMVKNNKESESSIESLQLLSEDASPPADSSKLMATNSDSSYSVTEENEKLLPTQFNAGEKLLACGDEISPECNIELQSYSLSCEKSPPLQTVANNQTQSRPEPEIVCNGSQYDDAPLCYSNSSEISVKEDYATIEKGFQNFLNLGHNGSAVLSRNQKQKSPLEQYFASSNSSITLEEHSDFLSETDLIAGLKPSSPSSLESNSDACISESQKYSSVMECVDKSNNFQIQHLTVKESEKRVDDAAVSETLEEFLNDECDEETKDQLKNTTKQQTREVNHQHHQLKMQSRTMRCADCDVRVCPLCYRNSRLHILRHFSGVRDSQIKFCDECHAPFFSECALQAHKNLHEKKRQYICPDCGFLYNKIHFFLQHCLGKCMHLYVQPQYDCTLCGTVIISMAKFYQHQFKEHTQLFYHCIFCDVYLKKSDGVVLTHVRSKSHRSAKAAHSFTSTAARRRWLGVVRFCDSCGEKCPSIEHMGTHDDLPTRAVYSCPCGKSFHIAETGFTNHRLKCPQAYHVPEFWRKIFADSEASMRWPEDFYTLCSTCNKSYIKKRPGKKNNSCPECGHGKNPLEKRCDGCGCLFNAPGSETQCTDCLESLRASALNRWIDCEEEVVDDISEKSDEFDTCEIPYDGPEPEEHSYALRHGLKTNVSKEWLDQLHSLSKPFFTPSSPLTIPLPLSPEDDYHIDIPPEMLEAVEVHSGHEKPVTCCVCDTIIPASKHALYKLLVHFETYHKDAALDMMVPQTLLRQVPDDEVYLLTRLHKDDEDDGHETVVGDAEGIVDGETVTDGPVASDRAMPPFSVDKDPHMLHLKVEEDVPEEIPEVAAEADDVRHKKEYEFWDEVNVALSAVEGGQREVTVPTFTSKRRVQKPKRYLEERQEENASNEKSCSGVKKAKSSTVEVAAPVKILTLIAIKSEVISEKEESSSSKEKASRKKEDDVDSDLEELKAELKHDNEIGFIAKTFRDSDGSTAGSHKRRLKPSSRMRYLQIVSNPLYSQPQKGQEVTKYKKQTCCFCKEEYGSREEFVTHIRTHRSDDHKLQCLLCGECFRIRSAIEKHLLVLHEIQRSQIPACIEENACSGILKKEKEEAEGSQYEDVAENQCKVCRLTFSSNQDLNKHFRIHGAAFLKEAQSVKTN